MSGFAKRRCEACAGVRGVIPACKACEGYGFRVVGPFDPVRADPRDELDVEFIRLRQKSIGCELDAAVFRSLLARVVRLLADGDPLREEIEDNLSARCCGADFEAELVALRERVGKG